jgi:hypothetical protein
MYPSNKILLTKTLKTHIRVYIHITELLLKIFKPIIQNCSQKTTQFNSGSGSPQSSATALLWHVLLCGGYGECYGAPKNKKNLISLSALKTFIKLVLVCHTRPVIDFWCEGTYYKILVTWICFSQNMANVGLFFFIKNDRLYRLKSYLSS